MRIEVSGSVPKAFGLAKAQVVAAARVFAAQSCARVRDAASDELHRAIMGVEGATDVITQAYDAVPPEKPGLYGELFVNTDQALRVAPKRKGWSPAKELLLYVAHGMDHLSGADDCAESDYNRMRRRELKWLNSLTF